MIQGYINDSIPIIAKFPSNKVGLSTVGYTILNINGTINTVRNTTGIVELGNGIYSATLTKTTILKGIIKWDTGDVTPSYDYDSILITDKFDAVMTRLNQIAPEVWGVSTRSLTTFGTLITDIRDAILNRATSTLTTFGSIGRLLVDNIDTNINSRASSSSISSIPTNVWNNPIRTLSSFGTLINDISLAVWAVSNRTLTSFGTLISDIWNNTDRTLTESITVDASNIWTSPIRTLTSVVPSLQNIAGVGLNIITVTINQDNILSSGHYIRVYDNLKTPLYDTQTTSNGIVTFNLNNGTYFIQVLKGGTFTQEQQIIVNNANQSIIFNTTSSTTPSYSTYKLTNLTNNYKWQSNEKANFVVSAKNNENQDFSITSGTYNYIDIDGVLVTGDCIIDSANKVVYFLFNPLKSGNYIITITVQIGTQQIKENFRVEVI